MAPHQPATRRYKNFHGEGSLNTPPLDTWQDNPTAHCVQVGTVCVVTTPTSCLLLQFIAQRYNNGHFVLYSLTNTTATAQLTNNVAHTKLQSLLVILPVHLTRIMLIYVHFKPLNLLPFIWNKYPHISNMVAWRKIKRTANKSLKRCHSNAKRNHSEL